MDDNRRPSRIDRPRAADALTPPEDLGPSISSRQRGPVQWRSGPSYVYIRGYSPVGDRDKSASDGSKGSQSRSHSRSQSRSHSRSQSRSRSRSRGLSPAKIDTSGLKRSASSRSVGGVSRAASPFSEKRVLSPGGVEWSAPKYGGDMRTLGDDDDDAPIQLRRNSRLPDLNIDSNDVPQIVITHRRSTMKHDPAVPAAATAIEHEGARTSDPFLTPEHSSNENSPTKETHSSTDLPYEGNELLVNKDYQIPKQSTWGKLMSHGFGNTTSFHFEKETGKEDGDFGYIIERLEDKDDIQHLPVWKRFAFKLSPFCIFLSQVAFWAYIGLRATFTLDAQRVANEVFPMAWLFMVIEIGVAIPGFLHQVWSLFLLKSRNRPKLRIRGDDVPTVDFFICCCGEDIDVILDTVRASCAMDYPLDRFRVLLLDDAKDNEVKEAVEKMSEQYPNLTYHARTKTPGVPHHFKAGNLNFGLDETKHLAGGPFEYVGAVDADMIPEPHMLRALVPHMMADRDCALSCGPQLFYNVPLDDILSQSLDYFVHVSEPIKDALGVAWLTGSGYILRRSAMDSIGGFPTGSLAEDVCCSSVLLGAGWKTTYVHEPLQYGTVPDSFLGHLKQRTRWTIGTIQTAFKLRLCLGGKLTTHMTFWQRFSGGVYFCSSLFFGWQVLSLFTLPIVLTTNGTMVAYVGAYELQILVRMAWAVIVLNRLNEFLIFLPSGYFTGRRESASALWMSPYHTIAIIRAFVLPTWLGGTTSAFKSSGSQKSDLCERDPAHRAPWYRRVWVFLWQYKVIFHVLYLMFVVESVVYSTTRCFLDHNDIDQVGLCLLVHAGWPPMLWLLSISGMIRPIIYCLFPPDMPNREELLVRDPKTGVAHPTEEAKQIRVTWKRWIEEVIYTIVFLISTAYFIGSFIDT